MEYAILNEPAARWQWSYYTQSPMGDWNEGGLNFIEKSSGARVWEISDSATAYDLCQTEDDIRIGDVLFIPSEKIVGFAGVWPIAITDNCGELHKVKADKHIDCVTYARIELKSSEENIKAAVELAENMENDQTCKSQ